MTCKLAARKQGKITVLSFEEGRILDERTTQGLLDELLAHVEGEQKPRIVWDFEGVEFVSSDMLVKMLVMNRNVQEAGGALAFCNLSHTVHEVLRTVKLDRLFSVFTTAEEALKRLRKK